MTDISSKAADLHETASPDNVVALHDVRIVRIEHPVDNKGPFESKGAGNKRDACMQAGYDMTKHYREPGSLTKAIGTFFKAAQARHVALHPKDKGIAYIPELAPWFFGILSTEVNTFDPDLCKLLDDHGFVLKTYRPAPGAFLEEDGQVVFIKAQAVCIHQCGVVEGLCPQETAQALAA